MSHLMAEDSKKVVDVKLPRKNIEIIKRFSADEAIQLAKELQALNQSWKLNLAVSNLERDAMNLIADMYRSMDHIHTSAQKLEEYLDSYGFNHDLADREYQSIQDTLRNMQEKWNKLPILFDKIEEGEEGEQARVKQLRKHHQTIKDYMDKVIKFILKLKSS